MESGPGLIQGQMELQEELVGQSRAFCRVRRIGCPSEFKKVQRRSGSLSSVPQKHWLYL